VFSIQNRADSKDREATEPVAVENNRGGVQTKTARKEAGEEMKHRSIVGFILVAAALFAAPQIAHDLLSLKSAVGARIRVEIVRAILGVSKGDGSEALMAQRTKITPETSAEVCEQAQAASKSKKAEAHATADTLPAAPTRQGEDQLAMLVSPSLLAEGAGAETSDAGDASDFDENVVVRSPGLPSETPAEVEIAALAPSDAVAAVPAPVGARSVSRSESGRERESREEAEAQRQLARFAVDIQTRKIDTQAAGVEILRKLAPVVPASYEFRVGGVAPRLKFVRIRRCVGKDNSAPVSYTPKAARQVAKCSTEITVPQAPSAE